jgi:hypothetical protein
MRADSIATVNNRIVLPGYASMEPSHKDNVKAALVEIENMSKNDSWTGTKFTNVYNTAGGNIRVKISDKRDVNYSKAELVDIGARIRKSKTDSEFLKFISVVE